MIVPTMGNTFFFLGGEYIILNIEGAIDVCVVVMIRAVEDKMGCMETFKCLSKCK